MIAAALTLSSGAAIAAPAGQVSCIYETVAPEKLNEFGKALIGEESEPGLDPILNAARNACIDQYGWSETDAGNAEFYFLNRAARERLAVIIGKEGLDIRKLDRAYAALVADFKAGKNAASPDHEALVAAMQKQGFPTDDQQLLKAAIGYATLKEREETAQMAFSDGTPAAR